ncbi:MAG: NAD(P)-dependent alcohol dehydrogenase [Chloroflexota bacterium]
MKAIVRKTYGDHTVLSLQHVDKPAPEVDQLLIKIKAVSINGMDWRLLGGKPYLIRLMGIGVFEPKVKILGFNIAGVVEAAGANISEFKIGDEVFGSCSGGGFAEFVCASEKALVLKPKNVTFEQAAAVPTAALTALQGLRNAGDIRAGQNVLIHGASGGVGSFAVQIAKYFGANVTAVCSTRNVEIARQSGADRIIDYTKEDFAESGQRYDLIFGINGNRSIYEYKAALTPKGTYIAAGGSGAKQLFQPMLLGRFVSEKDGRQLSSMPTARIVKEDLLLLTQMLESGAINPVIDDCYPLEKTPDAFRYLEERHAKGKVVIVP